jgi:lipopolysaccharide/colanic/teichoic acid biosynthesis glycosyltransferase
MKDFIRKYSGDDVLAFIEKDDYLSSDKTLVVATGEPINLLNTGNSGYETLVNLKRVNKIKDVDAFFGTVNEVLKDDGRFICTGETMGQRKERILKKYPFPFNLVYFFMDYILKRAFPKMKLTRWFYMWLTDDRNRVMSNPEIMGRLYFAGFREEKREMIDGYTWYVYRKFREPMHDVKPSYGPLLRIKRVGKNGKMITVYKFRTMVPYSEFIQGYVYEHNKLQDGGKFKEDFRITRLGGIMRKMWIDELPMVWNLLKGEIKPVGVRPLSPHYLSLYHKDLQEIRSTVKPGLLPPFYADMPKTLEEIMDSERKYIGQYKEHPIKTDIKYFFRILKNIIFHGKRSS